jgi:hypothetical protein
MNPSPRTAVWRLHVFTRAASAADSQRNLDQDIRAFFSAIVRQSAQPGHWIAATAPAKGGGVDVWFKLPAESSDAESSADWDRQLNHFGLTSRAVTGRN